jgi:hypothetical protein
MSQKHPASFRWCRWILWSITVLAMAFRAWLHVRLDKFVRTIRINPKIASEPAIQW